MKNNSGFTLIELILVIAILGILAVAVAPQFVDIQTSAHQAQADGVAGSIRDGINMSYAQSLASGASPAIYPAALDAAVPAACDSSNICFNTVLKTYPTSGWTKVSGNQYLHTGSSYTFTYDAAQGTFNR